MEENVKTNHRGTCDSDAWWEDRTIGQKVLIVIGFAILGIALLFLFGWVVMLLWNALMPDIFGLKRITYWQGWGLLALSSILFKGMGSSGGGGKSDRRRKKELRRHLREETDREPSATVGEEKSPAGSGE
ncbi:MAG: hypothetical protein WCT14_02140 [Treponemataceae bacterium]